MNAFELILLPIALSIVVLLIQAAFYRSHQLSTWVAFAGLAISSIQSTESLFSELILISSAAIVLFSSLRSQQNLPEEFNILLLSSTLGALVCVHASDFVSLFLGIELLSIPLYGLIAFDPKNPQNIQAAIKYLILAGTSSALMLFGIAVLYAGSGSLALALGNKLGCTLFLAGVCFKLSLAPFHFWTPDVYEESPWPVTAFLATTSKITFVAILANLPVPHTFRPMLTVIAVLSMLLGSLLTLKSDKMGRFLGYSSIAHMGYVLTAWMVDGNLGYYMTAYTLSLLLIFWVLAWGFDKWAILGFLSLMGMPMTPIFWAKYQVLISIFGTEHWGLFGIFIFSSLISVYGYGRMVLRLFQRV